MYKYAGTTSLILVWCFVLSAFWCLVSFKMVARRDALDVAPNRSTGAIPTLVLGPLFLLAAFRLLHVNLIFPVQVFSSSFDLLRASFIPGLILATASGLLGSVKNAVGTEYRYWRAQRFVTVGQALGKTPEASLFRLVVGKSLTAAWAESMPWLFGELIVVEAVFNAPGLGLDAWEAAKIRDFALLGDAMIWLATIYIGCACLATCVSRWVGKRLESYG